MVALKSSICLCFLVCILINSVSSVKNEEDTKNIVKEQKLELMDGVNLKIPRDNNTDKLFSFEFDKDGSLTEGRGKSKKKLLQRILPMFIMPFIIQSALTPFVLGMLKFMLIKAFLVGKLALTLIMFNAFRNHNSFKGRDSEMASAHYGYHGNGIEHYTSYFNE